MKNILVYTHSVDLDGWTSGALIKLMHELAFPEDKDNVNFIIKEWTYSMVEPLIDNLIGYDYFYLADLHFSNELIAKLYSKYYDRFIWFDHHQNSISSFYNDWKNFEKTEYVPISNDGDYIYKIEGIQSSELSACGLIWHYFINKIINVGNVNNFCNIFKEYKATFKIDDYNKGPWWLCLIDSYDRWNNSNKEYWDKQVMPFQFYMRSIVNSTEKMLEYINDFENTPNYETGLNGFFKNPFNAIIHNQIIQGYNILSYQNILYDNQLKNTYKLKLVFGEYNVCVLNTQDRGSTLFERLPDRNKYDLFVVWYYNGELYNYSMYTFKDNIDCAAICNTFGGGGHKQAAGFKSNELIFNKI